MVQLRAERSPVMTTTAVKFDFEPAQPTPGTDYDKFEERLLNAASGQSDDRGYSLADHMLGLDEGSPGGPALPIGASGAKALPAGGAAPKKHMACSPGMYSTAIISPR